MGFDVLNEGELDKLLEALREEIVDAHVAFKLLTDLVGAQQKYEEACVESPAFWQITLNGLRDSYFSALCRIYDEDTQGLNLKNLLDVVSKNRSYFDSGKFAERLRDNKFVDSLSQVNRIPTNADINRDRQLVLGSDPLVKKLRMWRHNIVAHRNAKIAIGRSNALDAHGISRTDVEELLGRSLRLYNKYSTLFRASTTSVQMVGQGDYESLLRFVVEGKIARRARYEDDPRS